jgi:glycine betaine/choline ABC-type transport system substrate-binding protein
MTRTTTRRTGGRFQNAAKWIAMGIYLLGLLAFLLAEMGVPWLVSLRATNQRILIFVLIFLPFVLPAAASVIQTLSLRISGQELRLEMREIEQEMRESVTRVAGEFDGRIGNAESILAPLLGGPDPQHEARLARRELVIGAKNDHAAEILGEILAARIETTVDGVTCHRRIPNGATLKNLADLKQGWIDVYVEFTGTACEFHNLDHRGKDPATLRAELDALATARLDATWLDLLGLRDNYCVAMRTDRARELRIETMSQLAALSSRLRFAGYVEFLNRADGFVGLARTYGFEFAEVLTSGVNDSYADLDRERADAVVGQESDPELQTDLYTAVVDDLGHFPDYHAAPLVSRPALAAIDGLEASLRGLAGCLDTAALSALVRERRARGSDPAIVRDIARRFVAELG